MPENVSEIVLKRPVWVAIFIALALSLSSSHTSTSRMNGMIHEKKSAQNFYYEGLKPVKNSTAPAPVKQNHSLPKSFDRLEPAIAKTSDTVKNEFESVNHPLVVEEKDDGTDDNDSDNDNDDESFSACILWMDDNFRLEEWLAYHYYSMKLRYVVMNIDPFSRTSPREIVDRWNDSENKYNLNFTIVTMTDADYLESFDHEMKDLERGKNSSTAEAYIRTKTAYHRNRQTEFYKACSIHLMEQNKSWTSYHDTDEFITLDHQVVKKGQKAVDISAESIRKMEQPGYIIHSLNSIKKKQPRNAYTNCTGLSCVPVNRRRYCSNELSDEEVDDLFLGAPNSNNNGTVVPKGFMRSSINSDTNEGRKAIIRRLDTLRYKYITPGIDGNPKSFIDLSQPNTKLYIQDKWHHPTDVQSNKSESKNIWKTHLPMRGLCVCEHRNRLMEIETKLEEERFVVNHYLGSFESYSFRDDARVGFLKSFEIWKERSNETTGEFSHVVRPWLKGFVELVGGPDVASDLLQEAGKFPEDYDKASRIKTFGKKYRTDQKDRRKRRKRRKGGT